MILPTNDGHPVKRVNYATEVNHDKAIRKEKGNVIRQEPEVKYVFMQTHREIFKITAMSRVFNVSRCEPEIRRRHHVLMD